jgi:hypothetical protein
MIGWLVDRIWAHKNRAELAALDDQMDYLRREGERLDKRMEETFGPDWRAEAERRLSKYLNGRYTLE